MPTITSTSNIPAIFDAAYALAQGISGITWQQQYQGLWPANAQIRTYPTLVVPYPEFAGFGEAAKVGSKTSVYGSQTLDMFWDINVYCVAPYAENDANTWRVPMTALGLLTKAFRADRYLSNTCFNSKLSDPHLMEWIDRTDPALRYFGCQLTIQVYEQVLTNDT